MGCKQPLIRVENLNKIEKTIDGKQMFKVTIVKPHDEHESIEMINSYKRLGYKYTLIPCKRCIGCRLDYSREWANRGYLEAKNWEQNYFVTLTYNNEHLPKNQSLQPKEFSNFIKRLRRELDYKNIQHAGIRFMGCGEYGSDKNTKRPHYHVILFNCKLPIETFYNPTIINNAMYYNNTIIEKCWKNGFSNITDVTWNNIAYTARYITKKIYGKEAKEAYKDLEPEFFRTSRNPGIAGYYYNDHADEIYQNDEIIIRNKKGSISSKPPKYFDKLLEKDNPELLEEIKKTRRKRQKESDKVKAKQTTLTKLQQLAVEERTLENRTLKLLREYEKKK